MTRALARTRGRRPLPAAVLSVVVAAVTALGACSKSATDAPTALPAPPPDTVAKVHAAGTLRIGVKVDQPGLSYRAPDQAEPQGFDVEIAKIVAARLGVPPTKIQWVETVSKNREKFLRDGTVDMVVASYSITDGRRILVGQAGPYFVTGQQLLVRKDDGSIGSPSNLAKKRVCSTTGSTSIQNVEVNYGAVARPEATYSACVQLLLQRQVDAVTTDGTILLGYVAQHPDELQVVGDTFTEERYGVGYPKGDTPFCTLIDAALTAAYKDGTWARAFRSTLGSAGARAPSPPSLDPCL